MLPSDVENQEYTSPAVDKAVKVEELTPYQQLCLTRLADYMGRAREYAKDLSHDEWMLGVLQKATYSVYCDCLTAGLAKDAHKILKKPRASKKQI